MASLFDKIKDIFKPNTQATTPAATQQSAPVRTTTNVANRPVGTQRVFAPTTQSSPAVEPKPLASTKTSGTTNPFTPATKIGSEGSLSQRAIKNGQSKGEDWSKASTAQKKYNETYYRTLDNPTHTKMYTDLESAIRTRKDATKSYSAGRDQLDSELDFVKKQYGKESNEYKALKQFIGDYEDLGRQMSANQAYDSASKASREMDQTIDTIFSGVINSPDYRAKVEEGRKKIEANPVVYHRYKLALDAASDKQRDLMYYTFNEEGDKGARDFFDRFMGDTLNYEKAAKDFASDVTTKDTKASRFWEANKANWASAIDGQFGTGVRQTLKDTKADPNDKTLVGDYNISDSVDDYLRSQIGGNISDDDLSTRGAQGYSQLRYSGSDWIKEADKDASEYQKNILGYLYLAYQSEDAAREAWDEIKQRSDAIWQTVNGSNSVATAASTAEGQLYRDYLGLAGADMPEWLGNPGQDTDLTVAQAVWDMAQTTRAQYPQIAANIVGAMAGGPTVGRVLGAAVMSTSAYGNAYKQAVDEGKDPSAAAGYAATQAASEFAVGMLLDGVAPIAGALTGNAGMKFVQNIANPFVKAVVNAGVRGLGEGTEEYIQEIAEPLIRNFWFKENNEFELFNEEAAYSFFLGAISALAMSPMSTNTEIKLNKNFAKIGNALNYQGSTEKLVDMILNNPVEGDKKSVKLYEEAKDLAEKIKNGTIKATDINAGELLAKYAEAGGDIGFLTDPETVAYTKETIGLDDMVAGATSMLSELGEDTALAADIAKLAMGETITEEAQTKINESTKAQEVLSQLQGDLDMKSNNALARAARATVFKGALNKVYSTLKNSNPDKNVITPAAQMLYDSGVEIKQAEKIGDVFNKVLDGQKLTANEAKLVKASSPAIRAAALQILGIDLSEYAGADMVLSQLNELAETTAKVKEQQAAVKRAAKPAAKARMSATQGGNANGQSRLQQNDQGGAAGLGGSAGEGTRGQGVPGGAGQEGGGFEGTGRQTHHLRRAGQRSRIDSAHAERSRGGSQRSGVSRYVPLNEYTEEEKALQERGVKRGAQNVLIVEGMDATTGYNPALGGYFILLPRDGQFTIEQYADHEPVHLWVDYALTPERRKVVLGRWVDILRAAMGDEDFQTFYDFIYKVYNGKGYFGTEAEGDRLSDDAIMYRIYADMLSFCHAGQAYGTDVNGVDPSQYKALARQFVDDYNLEAIGTGDMSNPAVREAIDNGWVNQEYYDRQGFNQTDSTEIDVGTAPETRVEEARRVTPVRSQSTQRAMNDADAESLRQSVKNLRRERKRLIREAEQNGTRNTQGHRDVINALNEQIEEYQSRIDDLTQYSADYEEENYGEETVDRSRVQGPDAGSETPVRSSERERNPVQKSKRNLTRKSERLLKESKDLHEDEVKNLVEFEEAEIVPEDQVPEDYRWIKDAFASVAPDSDVTYYRDDSEYAYYMFTVPSVVQGADGGFFVNLAKIEAGNWEDDGWTLGIMVNHEKSHYWLDKGGHLADKAWRNLRNRLLPNANEYSRFAVVLNAYRNWCEDNFHDAEEELICDIHAGRSMAFDMKAPELWTKVKGIVDDFFAKNTESNLVDENAREQHSADYDPEYFQSIGLINPNGTTASFTDNIGGVHEEILNQMQGTEGEDIKDFINRGGIRVKPNVGIEVNGDVSPTIEQYDVIDAIVENFTGKTFSIDFNINGTSAGTHTLEGSDIDPSRVYTYLRNYYARRKADTARNDMLKRFGTILGLPVKTMKDAYNVAKFQIQMDGDDPELQEIIDAYENQRYSADYDVDRFAEDFDTNEYLNETTELELDGFEIEGADPDIEDYVMAGGPTDLAGAPITNDVRNFFGRAQSYSKRTYEVVNGIIPLYLATDNLGFSAYDPSGKSDDGRSIFLTDNRAVGATYGKKGDNLIDMKALGALREHIASELGYEDFDDLPLPTTLAEDRSEDSIRLLYKMYNALVSYKGKTPWIKNKGKLLPVQVRNKLSNLRTSFPKINDLADEVNYSELRLRKADPDSVITEKLLNTVATAKEKIQSLLRADEAGNADISELLNLIRRCGNEIIETAANLAVSEEISETTRMGTYAALRMVNDVIDSSSTSLADALADGVFFPVTDTAGNRVEVSEVLNALADSGSWAVYANTTNPLVVWGEGSWWSDLADAIAGEEWEEDFWEWYDNYEYKDFDPIHPHINTRAIANYAYERGYDSAIMIDVHDKGGYRTKLPGGGKQPSTIYVVFNPNQIKSVNNKHPSQDRRMNYSADYLDNEDFDAQLASNALTEDVYRNDLWEVAEDNPEDKLQAEFDALFAELDAFPERKPEIMAKIGALQNKNMIRTAKTDDITTEEQNAPQEDRYKEIVESKAKTEKLKTPTEKAFQPKAEEKVDLPTERNRIGARIAELEDIGNERKLTDAEINELQQLDRRFDEIQKKIQDEYDERKKTATKEAFKPKKVTSEPVEKTEEKKPLKVNPIPKAQPKPIDNGVSPEERSEYEQLKAELEANPELADDPAFLARAAALLQEMRQQMNDTAEVVAQLEAQAEETTQEEETQPEPEDQKTITVKDDTQYARKDKKGGWWKNIGKANSIEIRRRRSDRNTFDVRITDAKGNTVTYDEVSPAMLTKAFGVKTGDRAVAMERAKRAAALAQNVSLNWSKFDNPKVEKVAAPKVKPNRSKDNLGREVPVRLSQYMDKSAIRTADGALINTYRLAAENGVHNARPMGKFSMFTERPASMNIQRGMTGAAAYGQSQKAAGAKLEAIFDKLADPKTSKAEVENLRKQIAQLEEENKKYVSGITRLDPTRPDFQFAQRENIVNGKSVLETYLDIRKPKVIDAKGQGLDFVTREVRNFVNDPENKVGQFDANRDPIGPNDGFKFTNVNVVPEGQTLGGGDRDLDTVYVTLRNNQAKSTYNTSPTTSDLLQYSADYDAMVEADAMSKGILEKRPTGFTDAKGYSISSDQAWLFDEAKMLDKEGHLVKGILPLYGGSKSMHLMWDPKTARKTKALYLATNPKVSEGYTKVPENQGKVADLMAYEQLIAKLANSVKMNADTLVEKIPALKKFAAGTDRYADEGARRLVVMYNNAISKDNPMRGKAELIPTDGKEPPRIKYADGTTSAATNIPNFLPAANIRMFYANTTNPFVIYGNHANWRHIYMGNNKAFMDWKKRVWDQPGYEEFEMKPDSTYVDTDTIVQYVLEETPNDSVIFHDIMDAIGQHPDGYGDVYVVFNPDQAKSVNNRHPTLDPRYNHSADYDAKVFGDMEDRGIIEKKPGDHDIDGNYISPVQASYFDMAKSLDRDGNLVYGVIPLFHGGRSIYLVWDPDKAKDSRAFFLTTNPAVAETYMQTYGKSHLSPGEMVDLVQYEAKLEEITNKLGIGDAASALTMLAKYIKSGTPSQKASAAETYAEIYNELMGDEYGKITPVESNKASQMQQTLALLEEDQYVFGDRLVELEDVMDSATDEELISELNAFHDLANDLFFAVADLRTADDFDWGTTYHADSLAQLIANAEPLVDPETGEILTWRLQEQAKRLAEQIDALDKLIMDDDEVLFENEGMDGFWSTFDDLPPILPGTGVSAFYANTTNPLVVDGTTTDWLTGEAQPGDWTHIDVSKNPELSRAFPRGYASTDEIAEYARKHDYDSVIIHNIYDLAGEPNDGSGAGDVYMVFNPNQIKSVNNRFPTEDPRYNHSADYTGIDTGYADGSLEDTILKILWDKDEERATAALIEYFYQFMQTGEIPQMENEKTQNIFQPRVTPGEAAVINDQFKKFVEEYGALEKGANPARDVVFPKKTDTGYARRFFRTAAESKNTPEWTMDALKREFLLGSGTYQRITDKSAIAYADRELQRKGYDKVLAEWQGKIDAESRLTKNDVAIGEALLIEAETAGDMETAMRLIAELAEVGTTAGQTVQAFSMLKKMPKAYQLYYFQRVANRLNRQYAKRLKNGKTIKLNSKLAKAVLNAKTKEDLDKAINALIQDIANQVPVNTADRWNAWRYLSMLGNPKTHIRNYLGNSVFIPAKFAKDLIAAGLETTLIKDPSKRNTSFRGLLDRRGTAEYRAFAEEDYEGIKQDLQSGGKYNPTNAVMEARTIFKTPLLEKLRKLNGEWLEKEDGIFLKFHYVNAMTNFLSTRGVSIAELQGTREGRAVLNAARQFAFTEAQKATYRDASAVAAALNQLKRVPVIGVLAEGMLPFTKTPINILKRGVEYSPIGLLDTATRLALKLKNEEITANEFADKLASGLTGTGIAIIGFWLASQGLLKGGDDDDDKQADADKLMGYQNYSINIGKTNYTIDWMAPSALPLFVGAAVFSEMREKNGLTGADFYNAMTAIAEPITQLSMLSGLNDTLKSAKWDDNPFASVVQSMGAGYISQGLPTILGQAARSFTANRRTTYVDKNSDIPQPLQRWMQTNVMGKVPGVNNYRAEYIDTWGRKDTTQSFLLRVFDNAISPGYRNEIEVTPVDAELQRLAKEVGTGVLVSPAERSIEFNNEKHNLTAEQYETYAKVRGNSMFSMLNELFNSAAYQGLTDEEKAKAVDYLKDYGNVLGKQAVFPEYEPTTDNWAEKCDGDMNRLINSTLLKAEANAAGVKYDNYDPYYSLVINSSWLAPVEQGYALAQQYDIGSTKSVYIRKGGPKYEVTPERKDVLYYHYRQIFPGYYVELAASDQWRNADNEKRLKLLSDLRAKVNASNKAWLAQQLYDSGAEQYTG